MEASLPRTDTQQSIGTRAIYSPNRSRSRSGTYQSTLSDSGDSTSPTTEKANQSRHMFLFAKSRRYRLKQLVSLYLDTELNTEDFAAQLWEAYYEFKGLWGSLFSTYGFSHCKFVKFEKYRPFKYAYRGAGIPDPERSDYYYNPRPPLDDPPVSAEEFRDVFEYAGRSYGSQTLKAWSSPLFGGGEDGLEELPLDTVDRIPQRYWLLHEKASKREELWGICIEEQRSALMVFGYILLCLSPSVTFCFLFMFGVITGDWQNATSMLVLSVSSLGLFFGSLLKH
jgi:hypothetical protein